MEGKRWGIADRVHQRILNDILLGSNLVTPWVCFHFIMSSGENIWKWNYCVTEFTAFCSVFFHYFLLVFPLLLNTLLFIVVLLHIRIGERRSERGSCFERVVLGRRWIVASPFSLSFAVGTGNVTHRLAKNVVLGMLWRLLGFPQARGRWYESISQLRGVWQSPPPG
jgi:hypothetical protein